uniref:Late blight resistance protein n=1 Tax=Solanum tuberosum TaxID=4113 RepID=M1A3I8_SOLTU
MHVPWYCTYVSIVVSNTPSSHTRTFHVQMPVGLHLIMMQIQVPRISIRHVVDPVEHSRVSVGASFTSQALPARRYEDLPLHAIHRARPLSPGTPSPTGTSPQLSAVRIVDSSSEQSDAMSARPSATLDDEMPTLAPG